MRRILVTLLIVACFGGCSGDAATRTLRVGMPLSEAGAMLSAYGATPTGYQMLFRVDKTHPVYDLHWYSLPSGTVIELKSEREGDTPKVVDIRESAFVPHSWTSKQDPEKDTFFASFKSVDRYELKNPGQ